jgi:three-Cys-motif partner protein
MSRKENYIWNLESNQLPILEPHSEAKHEILADYLKRYIHTLYDTSARRVGESNPKLTIVDGFAGGGVYCEGKSGSPFVLLRAVKEAEFEINKGRTNPIVIDANFFFVEKNKNNLEYLRYVLEENGYAPNFDQTLFLVEGDFNLHAGSIIEHIQKRSPRNGGRAIFFLDQTGYTDVKPSVLRYIVQKLPKAEMIINIAITWFIDFLSFERESEFKSMVNDMGLSSHLNINELIEIKEQKGNSWRFIIESKLSVALKNAIEVSFFTPFFIEPLAHHRGYWLLHLARHQRARSVMLDVHWDHGNDFTHCGGMGMGCLAYKPQMDYPLFKFSQDFRQQTIEALAEDISRIMIDQYLDGITVEQLIQLKCNDTVANNDIFKESILSCWEQNGLEVKGKKGGDKTSRTISDKDILLPKRQLILL